MFPSEQLAHLAADAKQRAGRAQSPKATAALEQAAAIWDKVRGDLLSGKLAAPGTKWEVGKLLDQADELAAQGNPEHTAVADDVWDDLYCPVDDDRYGHCAECGEEEPENDGDGYTVCCNKRVCDGNGGMDHLDGHCCRARYESA